MAIHLEYGNKIILNCKNAIWGVIHKNITGIIEQERLKISLPIKNFLEESDQDIYGVGSINPDFDQINTLKEMIFFADLVKKAIDKWLQDVPNLPENYKECVWEFYKNLLEIAEGLD